MKSLLFAFLMMFSSSAFAISNDRLVAACRQAGAQKLAAEAQANGCRLDPRSLQVTGIDNRFYNPSKYVWYGGRALCAGGRWLEVQTLTQYSGGSCF